MADGTRTEEQRLKGCCSSFLRLRGVTPDRSPAHPSGQRCRCDQAKKTYPHQALQRPDDVVKVKSACLLTGESDFYQRIAIAIKGEAFAHGAQYREAFDKKRNELLRQFMVNFVNAAGDILWETVVEYNSSKAKAPKLRTNS